MAEDQERGSVVAVFFCLNSVVGAGFLGIPYVLYHGGVLYGVFLIVALGLLAIAAAEWTIEAMARAESFRCGLESGSTEWHIVLLNDERRVEVGDLCRLFIHPWLGNCYDAAVVLSTLLFLWAFGTLAANSWASELPFSGTTFRRCESEDFLHHIHPDGACWNAYSVCILIFGAFVVPISCLDLHAQTAFQMVMAVARILVVIGISIYSVVEAVRKEVSEHYVWLHFDFRQWIGVIPVVSYALTLHFMIPTFSQLVRNKKLLRPIFTTALSLASLLYIIIGVTVASCFTDEVNETCTLNWVKTAKSGHSILLRIYSYFIVIFPSIDFCSGYPLFVNVGVNVLYSLIKKVSGRDLDLSGSTVTVGRFCMATIPLIGSLFVSNLVAVLDFAGLFYIFVVFVIPALLHVFSKWKSTDAFDTCAQIDSNEMDTDVCNTSLLHPANSENVVGDVAVCYQPVVGKNRIVVIACLIFSIVAICSTVSTWFSRT